VTTSRSVTVSVDREGDLVWSGHDLGPGVAGLQPGADEYEFWRTIRAAHIPALVTALGGRPGESVARLVRARFNSDVALADFAEAHGIPTEFNSWIPTSWDD